MNRKIRTLVVDDDQLLRKLIAEQLVKAGVDTELHVWEGLFHGFFYNADVPESRDALNVIVRFFDRHLGNMVDSGRVSAADAKAGSATLP